MSGTRQGWCPLFILLLNIVLEFQATQMRQEKETNKKEEVKLSLFANDTFLHFKDPKDFIKKLLELINPFGNIGRYKIHIQKSVTFLYTYSK
jgi:hypothetical protein